MLMTQELLVNFFKSVGVRGECPVCNTTKWFIPENTELEGTGVLMSRVDGHDLSKLKVSGMFVYVICANCDFVRTHSRPQIVKWARSQAATKGAANG